VFPDGAVVRKDTFPSYGSTVLAIAEALVAKASDITHRKSTRSRSNSATPDGSVLVSVGLSGLCSLERRTISARPTEVGG
jgi:hypothetical protein